MLPDLTIASSWRFTNHRSHTVIPKNLIILNFKIKQSKKINIVSFPPLVSILYYLVNLITRFFSSIFRNGFLIIFPWRIQFLIENFFEILKTIKRNEI